MSNAWQGLGSFSKGFGRRKRRNAATMRHWIGHRPEIDWTHAKMGSGERAGLDSGTMAISVWARHRMSKGTIARAYIYSKLPRRTHIYRRPKPTSMSGSICPESQQGPAGSCVQSSKPGVFIQPVAVVSSSKLFLLSSLWVNCRNWRHTRGAMLTNKKPTQKEWCCPGLCLHLH